MWSLSSRFFPHFEIMGSFYEKTSRWTYIYLHACVTFIAIFRSCTDENVMYLKCIFFNCKFLKQCPRMANSSIAFLVIWNVYMCQNYFRETSLCDGFSLETNTRRFLPELPPYHKGVQQCHKLCSLEWRHLGFSIHTFKQDSLPYPSVAASFWIAETVR